MRKEAAARFGITPKWVDTHTAFEGEPMQIRSQKVTHADTVTCGGQNGHRRWESRTDEEEHVRNEGTRPAVGNIGKSTSGTGDVKWDSVRKTCFITKKIECRV